MRASLSLIRFCGDVLIGCLALAAVWATGFGLLQVMPGFMRMVLDYTGTLGIFIAGGIVVPPVVLFVMGFVRKRHGLTLSPLVAAAIPATFFVWTGYQQMLEVRGMEQRAFLKPEAKHDMLLLPASSGCGPYCMQVLTETNYSVVGHEPSSDAMVLYRKASGDVCYEPENVPTLVAFTRAGYAGVCSIKKPIKAVEDALILERQTATSGKHVLSLPSGYEGAVYSFIERRQGKDRLLGRWADGTVRSLADFQVGPRFDDADFYGAALGLRFTKKSVFGPDDLNARVEKLRPVLKSPEVQPEAVWAYGDLLDQLRKSRPAGAVPGMQETDVQASAENRGTE